MGATALSLDFGWYARLIEFPRMHSLCHDSWTGRLRSKWWDPTRTNPTPWCAGLLIAATWCCEFQPHMV